MPTRWYHLTLVGVGALACAPDLAPEGREQVLTRASCSAAGVAIHDIQGSGSESPLVGVVAEAEGVVTALRPSDGAEVGFFMQTLTPDADRTTSEGLFVTLGQHHASPAPGRHVRVRGQVREWGGMTELHAVELVQECGNVSVEPARPDAWNLSNPHSLEGMWIRVSETWTLIETWRALQAGEVTVSRGGRLYATGHELGINAGAGAERRWLIEDGALRAKLVSDVESPPRLRLGEQQHEPTGVVFFRSGAPALLVTQPLEGYGEVVRAPPSAPLAELRVAALNLDNYFVRLGGRGAASEVELQRQRSKLVAALLSFDADILALTELENHGQKSVEHLLSALNAELATERRYTWSEALPPAANPLRAALAYRASRVWPEGEAWFDASPSFTRPPIFQTFDSHGTPFTVGVVHLKSKRCGGEPQVLGVEGCGRDTRLEEAAALIRSTQSLSLGGAQPRMLLLGDFNSDPLEAPMLELKRAGFVDLLGTLPAEDRYSYVFEGRASLLDHALATPELSPALRRAFIWHINADEPSFRSYSLDNPPGQYRPDAFRSSDHDPIIIDLAF